MRARPSRDQHPHTLQVYSAQRGPDLALRPAFRTCLMAPPAQGLFLSSSDVGVSGGNTSVEEPVLPDVSLG